MTTIAASTPIVVAVDAGLQAHALREEAADGSALVRESAIAPVLGVRLSPPSRGADGGPAWSWQAGVRGWAADARYDGRTQGGSPVESRTGTTSVVGEALVVRAVGEHWRIDGGIQVERLTRRIRGVGAYAGLDERTTQARGVLGVRRDVGTWQAWGRVMRGPGGTLSVRFDGALADDARITTGRTSGWAAGLSRPVGEGWRLAVELEQGALAASSPQPLTARGRPLGTVAQPRWVREQLHITVSRSFE